MRLFRVFSRSPFLCAVGNLVPFLALGLCVYLSFFLAYLKFINSIDLFKELTFGFVDFPLMFIFSVSLLFTLIVITPLLLVALGLTCSFSDFVA